MPNPSGKPPLDGTRLESSDEIQQAIKAHLAAASAPAPVGVGGKAVKPAAAPEPETPVEKPQQRPPMAMICLLDDGRQEGEWFRLRAERTVLGRSEGDIRISHEVLMSGRHAEIVRQKTGSGYRWVLTDLGSTNGTYVRCGSTVLRPQAEVILGRGHYRYEGGAAAPADAGPSDGTTRAWTAAPIQTLVPSLVELTPSGVGQRWPLTLPEYWIGRDPQLCPIARADDLFLNPRHARLHRDAKGQWHIENNKSVNGVWLRIEEIPLGATCQFRLGEQRFFFRVI